MITKPQWFLIESEQGYQEATARYEEIVIGIDEYKEGVRHDEPFGISTNGQVGELKCINLDSLIRRTRSNPKLMIEMISLYLDQTPPLVSAMKQSFQNKDWNLLRSAVHKMIPSFSIMGISTDFEDMAKKVQEFARLKDKAGQASTQLQTDARPNWQEIHDLVLQLEKVCGRACRELKEEVNIIKNKY